MKSARVLAFAVVLVYLLIPTAIHPHLVLSLIAPITGFSVALAVTRFKKYL